MSHYIHSFLIEPVIRQARRFSRPSEEGSRPDAVGRVAGDGLQHALPLRRRDDTPEEGAAVLERYGTQSSEDGVSSNPVYGIPESLASTTSSLTSSAQTGAASNPQVHQDSTTAIERNSDDIERRHSEGRPRRLPADDGMGLMRKRIVAIQRTNSSNAEKARMVHELMTEQYSSSQPSLHAPHSFRPRSPASLTSQDRPFTPASLQSVGDNSIHCTSPPTSLSSVAEGANIFHLTREDLEPTFYRKPTANQTTSEPENRSTDRLSDDSGEESKALGCPHYKRNIKLQCSACYRWYTCRFCHDEIEDHSLNRRETKNMLCMLCGCAQSASEECCQCGERSARYYCGVCKLWDDDPGKSIYHCNDCGICRIGQGLGKDFYHCKTCCVCLSIGIRETHRCIERSTDCDCPICGEYMFTSPQTVVFMGCGHSIHHRCYYEHMKRSYRCPICSRSIVNMEMQFRHLERAIENQPMPPEFQDTKALVYCNDCNVRSSVKYHWLGLKCGVCDSYNTAQLQIIRGPQRRHITNEPPPNSQTRGRMSEISAQIHRTANSAPPSAGVPAAEGPFDALRRPRFMPDGLRHVPLDGPLADSDEEYSDVDFWGLESPRQGAPSELHDDRNSSGSEDEDEDDSGDEDMSDDDDDDDDDDDEDADGQAEDDEEDVMELFGHR